MNNAINKEQWNYYTLVPKRLPGRAISGLCVCYKWIGKTQPVTLWNGDYFFSRCSFYERYTDSKYFWDHHVTPLWWKYVGNHPDDIF